MHYNDDGILIQSLECHKEPPVRHSAEQAVKVPLPPLQGSGDSANRDDNTVSSIFPVFHSFHLILHYFLHSESVLTPRMTAGSTLRICALMHRDDCKIRKFKKGASGNLPLIYFRLPKNAKQVALQAKSY